MIQKSFFLLAVTCLSLSAEAFAGNISLRHSDGVDYISIEGDIEESDVAHFQRLAVASETAVVVLGSPGGALSPALEIGKIIRLKGFGTYVPSGVECTSSCALIWVSGQPRMLSRTSRIGFHASYTVEGGRQLESGVGNAMVGRYLTLLNLSERAVIFATSASPDRVEWVNPNDGLSSGIEFTIIEDTSETEPSADTEVSSSSSPIIANNDFSWSGGGWSVYSDANRAGCFTVISFSSEGGQTNASSLMIGKDRNSDNATLSFSNDRFKSIREGEKYSLLIYFLTGDEVDDGWGEKEFIGLRYPSGQGALTTSLNWRDLSKDISSEETVSFYFGDELADVFPLKGSAQAMRELDKCLGPEGSSTLSDPFR